MVTVYWYLTGTTLDMTHWEEMRYTSGPAGFLHDHGHRPSLSEQARFYWVNTCAPPRVTLLSTKQQQHNKNFRKTAGTDLHRSNRSLAWRREEYLCMVCVGQGEAEVQGCLGVPESVQSKETGFFVSFSCGDLDKSRDARSNRSHFSSFSHLQYPHPAVRQHHWFRRLFVALCGPIYITKYLCDRFVVGWYRVPVGLLNCDNTM